MNILITGGLGFIGSHICVELLNINHNVIVIDNLVNSKRSVIDKIKEITNKNIHFYQFDLNDKCLLNDIFKKYNFDAIIHLAGLKSVGESITMPITYYNNNIGITLNLLEMVKRYNIKKFVFSSSATVYGSQSKMPVNEHNDTGIGITNPYGRTKYFIEEIIKDFSHNSDCKFVILRYFNPIGSHESGLIGENPNNIPNNLMPLILNVVKKKSEHISIFGTDYDTPDGTCIRDFIHVVDLAKAHIKSIEFKQNNNIEIFNIGTGNGVSVSELLSTFMSSNKIMLSIKYANKRNGDLPSVYANVDKANNLLEWKAEKTVTDMCKDAYNYVMKNN